MAWANTFAGLTELLSEPRSDCPVTLPDLPATPADAFLQQRQKPLNEHMISQIQFYCALNFPEEFSAGHCPGNPTELHNQGLASDWIREQSSIFHSKMK